MVKKLGHSKNKWQMKESDVSWYGSASTSTKRKKRSIASRAVDLRSQAITLTHVSTNLVVTAEIPEGHYSKKQMQQLRDKVFAELWIELEKKVARHLKVAGL